MSSHREAPEISKDPVADSTDLYAFVSPDQPRHGDAHRQLRPPPGPGRRAQLLRVRRRRPLRHPHRQRRRRLRRRQPTTSSSPARSPTRTPSSTTPGRSLSLTTPTWNRRQTYSVTRVDHAGQPRCSAPGSPARRATSGRCPPPTTRRWPARPSPPSPRERPGLRRATGRGLLRRPRRHLRPRRPEAVRAGPHHLRPGQHRSRPDGQGCQLHRRGQRPQHRHPDPDQRAHRQRPASRVGDRPATPCSGCGPPPAGRRPGILGDPAGIDTVDLGSVHPGVAAREPAGQRGDHPAGRQGLLEPQPPVDDSQFASHVSPTPSWPGCSPCSTRGCSPISPPTTRPGRHVPTCWPSS